jgi:transposase
MADDISDWFGSALLRGQGADGLADCQRFCEAADSESKGENLVGYAKRDPMIPQATFVDLATANAAAAAWCTEVRATAHSEICARLVTA